MQGIATGITAGGVGTGTFVLDINRGGRTVGLDSLASAAVLRHVNGLSVDSHRSRR